METLPKIILDAYSAEKKSIRNSVEMHGMIIVVVSDSRLPAWQAVDCWIISDFSKDWACRGRTTVFYANSNRVTADTL